MSGKSVAVDSLAKAGVVLAIDVASIIGNAVVVAAIFRNVRLRTLTNIFVVSLSLADFLMAVCIMTFTAVALIEESWILGDFACKFYAYLVLSLSCISLHTMAFTAINRYVRIVRQEKYATIFTRKSTVIMVVFTWVHGLSFGVLYIWASGGEVIFIKDIGSCFPRKIPLSVCLPGYLLPSSAIFVCYFLVFRSVRQQLHGIGPSLSSQSAQHLGPHVEEVKITRTLFTVVLGFLICWVPTLIIGLVVAKLTHSLPPGYSAVCFGLIYVNSAINPIIYGIMNKTFRAEYMKILQCK